MKRALATPSLLLGLVCLGISVGALSAAGQTATATSSNVDSKSEAILAVNIIRVINTAEVVTCRAENGKIDPSKKFHSWNDLLNATCFRQAQSRFSGGRFSQVSEISFSSGPEIVPGLELRLVVSPDGSHYQLWLGQKQEVQCGFAFYSDERGVIYEGKAIGCNPHVALGKP